MTAIAAGIEEMTLSIKEETHVRAPIAATFAALLEEMGPSNEGQPGTPMPFTLEAWPGGRWFRDLGNGNGHLWGHVQAIKPVHEWTSQFERHWRRQLTRIKERAERASERSEKTSSSRRKT